MSCLDVLLGDYYYLDEAYSYELKNHDQLHLLYCSCLHIHHDFHRHCYHDRDDSYCFLQWHFRYDYHNFLMVCDHYEYLVYDASRALDLPVLNGYPHPSSHL
ncbi:hypothetical protein D3C76_1632620 [compost metagenome]